MQTLWLSDASGTHQVQVSSPNTWHGETDCVVGPFSSEKAAQGYVTAVQLSDYDRVLDVFVRGNAWYVSVAPLR
jgi:hypothetical protein